jgi:hypothetical protein
MQLNYCIQPVIILSIYCAILCPFRLRHPFFSGAGSFSRIPEDEKGVYIYWLLLIKKTKKTEVRRKTFTKPYRQGKQRKNQGKNQGVIANDEDINETKGIKRVPGMLHAGDFTGEYPWRGQRGPSFTGEHGSRCVESGRRNS